MSRLSTEKLQPAAAELAYVPAFAAAVQISADENAVTTAGDTRSLPSFPSPRAVRFGGDGATAASADKATNASIPSAAGIPVPIAGRAAFAIPEICPPTEIAARVCQWSLAKTSLSLDRLIVLGFLAGIYIGFGSALYVLVLSEGTLGFGPMRWLGGMAFSLGLVLVVMGGAELSTGNCLMALARGAGVITWGQVWRNWSITYVANAMGAAALAGLIVHSGALDAALVRQTLIKIAEAKLALPVEQAFLKGILANMLVCLAVWLTLSTQTTIGKLIGIVFPISAFVALGFEHSIANCFTLPAGMMLGAGGTTTDLMTNLVAVTLGNLIGGALCIGSVFGLAHAGTAAQP